MPIKDLVKRREYQRAWARKRYLRAKTKVVALLGDYRKES